MLKWEIGQKLERSTRDPLTTRSQRKEKHQAVMVGHSEPCGGPSSLVNATLSQQVLHEKKTTSVLLCSLSSFDLITPNGRGTASSGSGPSLFLLPEASRWKDVPAGSS